MYSGGAECREGACWGRPRPSAQNKHIMSPSRSKKGRAALRYHCVLRRPSLFRSITHARHNLIHCRQALCFFVCTDICTHFRAQCGILGLSKPSGEILGSDMCACRSVPRMDDGWTTDGTEGGAQICVCRCLPVCPSLDRPTATAPGSRSTRSPAR